MRRSKSDPRKYARNYRAISQRRMTVQDDDRNMDQEMERLQTVLRDSETHVKQGTADLDDVNDVADADADPVVRKRKRNRNIGVGPLSTAAAAAIPAGRPETPQPSEFNSLLSEEMQQELGDLDNPLVLQAKKKKKPKKATVELTPQEIRQARLLQKNTARKIQQLQDRAAQKKKRVELYTSLKDSAISKDQRLLLESSSTLGKRVSKKEQLQKLLRKERAGLALTVAEQDLLYKDRNVKADDESPPTMAAPSLAVGTVSAFKPSSTKSKQKTQKGDAAVAESDETAVDEKDAPAKPEVMDSKPATSLAAQMMASLSQLKTASAVHAEEAAKERVEAQEEKRLQEEKELASSAEHYVPTNPAILKTAAALGLEPEEMETGQVRVKEITRPDDVKSLRYDLPVAGMEFEVMDAIRNNDVTIICGETGSGKSTQVPQFLYEAGLSTCSNSLIGVTQPRRVAAVSTAKRVCYEMGQGNGQTIESNSKGKGNMVAYQTRYETAGLGTETRVKFATDGILLTEIQSDLLLRKYSVIILDEAHERNLNTDVLIGLLSAAIPLRKQAAAESGSEIAPLKLIIMSATLRVEDFTGNKTLFSSTIPAVVRIPGRTHPVTVHHSKLTELDDYSKLKAVFVFAAFIVVGCWLLFSFGYTNLSTLFDRLQWKLHFAK